MLTEQELEAIYNLLHSPVEDNVNLALAIIEGREEVKRVFDEAKTFMIRTFYRVGNYNGITYHPCQKFSFRESNYVDLKLNSLQQAHSKIYAEN